jgi:hypothetical protein
MTVEVVGLDRYQSTLAAFGRTVAALPDAAHRAAADPVARAAASRARRLTGRLAAGFTVATTADGADVVNAVPYASVQELGWPGHNISPSYALRGALAESTDAVLAAYTDAVDTALDTVEGA